MGSFLDKPDTKKLNDHGMGNGLRFGVASMQGWRIEMEDAHCAVIGLGEGLEDWSFFAVFDGHAGDSVSALCAEQLLGCIISSEEFQEDIPEGIRTGFLKLDDRLRQIPKLASGEDKAGSTAVCALISPYNIYIANCGDSRAVLCRAGSAVFSTRDHKPGNPLERKRIINAGGTVLIQRVNGALAVSRALGDYAYKKVVGRGPCEQLVSPEPEIYIQLRQDEHDEFLVLACDGIWDVMSNNDVCQYVHSQMFLTDNLETISNSVIDTCLYKGSKDNMSIVLVAFRSAPRPTEEAILLDKAVDSVLEKAVRGIVREDPMIEFGKLLSLLGEQNIPNLPPGGGLYAKRPLIKAIFKELCPETAEQEEPI